MARAFSDDLRLQVLKATNEGLSPKQAAARFGVSTASAIRWIARAKIGELEARPQGRHRKSRIDCGASFIFALIEDQVNITLDEMVRRLAAERSVEISRSALGAWLSAHGWTFKKSPFKHWSRDRP